MRSAGSGCACGASRSSPSAAGPERLLDLAHLGALEVAHLGREALEPGAGQRDGLHELGVAVARDDLGRDRLARQPEPLEHPHLVLGAVGRVGADGARDRAHRRLREGALEPRGVARGLHGEAGELEPERRRLGVHAVGAPDAERWPGARGPARPARRRARARPRRSPRRPGAAAAPSAVSSTSDEVRPKWIQRPAGPAEAASTSTNAATSWSVTRSRSAMASTVNVAPRIASSSSGVGPLELLRGRHLHLAHGLHARLSVQIRPSSGRV